MVQMNDQELAARHTIHEMARTINELRRRMDRMDRTYQLANLDVSELGITDAQGNPIGSISDGGGGVPIVKTHNPQPPPVPSPPSIAAGGNALAVTWDGTFVNGLPGPVDFSCVEIHMSEVDGFTPSEATLVDSIHNPAGATRPVAATAGIEKFLVLRTLTTSGIYSGPSDQVSGTADSFVSDDVLANIQGALEAADAAGAQADAVGAYAAAIGAQAAAAGAQAAAIGAQAAAIGSQAELVGEQAQAAADNAIALGAQAEAIGEQALSVALGAQASGVQAIAIGSQAAVVAAGAQAAGAQAQATGAQALAATQNITSTQITDGAITTPKIQAGAITGGLIQANQITGAMIQAGTITAANIQANTITGGLIQAGTITGALIQAGTIQASNIQASTITGDRIQVNTIQGRNIQASTITGALIQAGTIQAGNVQSRTITGDLIQFNTIQGTTIQASTITGDNIQGNTITGDLIQSNTIQSRNIGAQQITADLIQFGTIQGRNIQARTITGDNIQANTIQGVLIQAGTIQGDRIQAGTIQGDRIQANTLQGGLLQANAIDGMTITGAIVRTSSSNPRVELDSVGNRLKFYDPTGAAATIYSPGTGVLRFVSPNGFGLMELTGTNLTLTGASLNLGSGEDIHLASDGQLVHGTAVIVASNGDLRSGGRLTVPGVATFGSNFQIDGGASGVEVMSIPGFAVTSLGIHAQVSASSSFYVQTLSGSGAFAPLDAGAIGFDTLTVHSSKTIKKNIKEFAVDSPAVLRNLRPVHYELKAADASGRTLTSFIAEDVQQVFPEAFVPARPGDPYSADGVDLTAVLAAVWDATGGILDRLDAMDARIAAIERPGKSATTKP